MNSAVPPAGPTHETTYRADIDGLRAAAVLSVLGFHAGLTGFAGGFIGVDVFFVISGYLISGIIFSSLDRGTFTFREFYVRRVNRIFPALIATLLVTAVLGWLFLFRNEIEALGKHIAGGAVYASNFLLASEAGYFDSQLKPLLHLWSLGVEEQFYLFFPFLALIAWRAKWKINWLLLAMIEMSFALGLKALHFGNTSGAFYLPHMRIWEILSGALLLSLERDGKLEWIGHQRFPTALREALAGAGIIAVVASVALMSESLKWPGFWALIPVAGTVAIIAAGQGTILNRSVLGHPFAVGIGLISYPLYLWHWPLLVFAKLINEGEPPLKVRLAILAISFVLALATYHFVEKPIRFGRHKSRSAARLLPALGGVGVLGVLIMTGFIPARLDSNAKRSLAEIGPEWEVPQDGSVTGGKGFLTARLPGDVSHSVALFGDSHMQQYWPRVLELSARSQQPLPTFALITYGGCPSMPGVNRRGVSWDGRPWTCPDFYRAAMAYLARPEVRVVIISSFWEDYFERTLLDPATGSGPPLTEDDPNTESAFSRLAADLSRLSQEGKSVYIILPSPNQPARDAVSHLPRRLAGFGRSKTRPGISRSDFVTRVGSLNARLRALAQAAHATVVDPVEHLCERDVCPTVTSDGLPVYKDDNHLRAGFVRKNVTFLDPILAK
jgi:peptidoglycan/LPS O-acetylase OafA/YrhL